MAGRDLLRHNQACKVMRNDGAALLSLSLPFFPQLGDGACHLAHLSPLELLRRWGLPINNPHKNGAHRKSTYKRGEGLSGSCNIPRATLNALQSFQGSLMRCRGCVVFFNKGRNLTMDVYSFGDVAQTICSFIQSLTFFDGGAFKPPLLDLREKCWRYSALIHCNVLDKSMTLWQKVGRRISPVSIKQSAMRGHEWFSEFGAGEVK